MVFRKPRLHVTHFPHGVIGLELEGLVGKVVGKVLVGAVVKGIRVPALLFEVVSVGEGEGDG